LDADLTRTEIRDGLESALGEIEGCRVVARRANVGDSNSHGLAVLRVLHREALSAPAGFVAGVAVVSDVDGCDVVGVAVDGAAGTGVAALVEVRGKATSHSAGATGGGAAAA